MKEVNKDPIIALKIFDQCSLDKCLEVGPILSDEECECAILELEETKSDIGKIILPCSPICVPQYISSFKILNDSFKLKNITIIDIKQTPLKKGYWDVDIKFEFTFKLQLLSLSMQPYKILHCDIPCNRTRTRGHIKDYIKGKVSYIQQITLYGGDCESPIIASDIFTPKQTLRNNTPHALVEAKAFPLDVNPNCCDCSCIFDDIYEEPTVPLYITIGLNTVISLFRLKSILVKSYGYTCPKNCADKSTNPCDYLNNIDFPNDLFFPE